MEKKTDNKRSAHFRPRCDKCGRFVWVGEPGGSWVMVPETDCNVGDERERCPVCTAKHGQARCEAMFVAQICCGINKKQEK